MGRRPLKRPIFKIFGFKFCPIMAVLISLKSRFPDLLGYPPPPEMGVRPTCAWPIMAVWTSLKSRFPDLLGCPPPPEMGVRPTCDLHLGGGHRNLMWGGGRTATHYDKNHSKPKPFLKFVTLEMIRNSLKGKKKFFQNFFDQGKSLFSAKIRCFWPKMVILGRKWLFFWLPKNFFDRIIFCVSLEHHFELSYGPIAQRIWPVRAKIQIFGQKIAWLGQNGQYFFGPKIFSIARPTGLIECVILRYHMPL